MIARLGPLLELASLDVLPDELVPVAEVGRGDRAWPRADAPPVPRALSCEDLAAWVREHAREQLDEVLWVRLTPAGVVDVALGVRWSPAPADGWRLVGPTSELVALWGR